MRLKIDVTMAYLFDGRKNTLCLHVLIWILNFFRLCFSSIVFILQCFEGRRPASRQRLVAMTLIGTYLLSNSSLSLWHFVRFSWFLFVLKASVSNKQAESSPPAFKPSYTKFKALKIIQIQFFMSFSLEEYSINAVLNLLFNNMIL